MAERTLVEQREDMFRTMNGATENRKSECDNMTFESIQDNMVKRGGRDAHMVLSMRKCSEEKMKETCALCGKRRDEHDSRGLIYFSGSEDNLKAGWSCVENLVRKNKI